MVLSEEDKAERAAYLRQLVEAKEWDKIREVAAQYEAEKKPIREQVEDLVKEVVPEELDRVDEMLEQFQGREQDLLKTLKKMVKRQERKKSLSNSNSSPRSVAWDEKTPSSDTSDLPGSETKVEKMVNEVKGMQKAIHESALAMEAPERVTEGLVSDLVAIDTPPPTRLAAPIKMSLHPTSHTELPDGVHGLVARYRAEQGDLMDKLEASFQELETKLQVLTLSQVQNRLGYQGDARELNNRIHKAKTTS